MRTPKSKPTHIPQTSSWVTWPTGKRGLMHITAALPLHDGPSPRLDHARLRRELKKGTTSRSGGYVPIELKFPRSSFDLMMQTAAYFQEAYASARWLTEQEYGETVETLADIRAQLPKHMRAGIGGTPQEFLDDWAFAIVETLHYYGLHCAGKQSRPTMEARWMSGLLPDPRNSQYRKAQQTLDGMFGGMSYQLVLQRSGLCQLGALASTPKGKRGFMLEVRLRLLPSILTELGSKPLPRGRHQIQAKFLQRTAAVAIFMAQMLIAQVAGGDEVLRKKLAKILPLPVRSRSRQEQHRMALELAERTLHPAWERHKISAPLELDLNKKAYKHFCPPQRRTALSNMLKQLTPLQREKFTASWFRRLLGPEGQAAKDLDLL